MSENIFKNIEGNSNNHYCLSKNIRVFPCAYRGYYESEGTEEGTEEGTDPKAKAKVFDPEARSTTEANFTNTFHKVSANKETYVISWDNNNEILKCVIGGYYFEISHYKIADFFYSDGNEYKPYHLCIKIADVELGTDEETDGERKTPILSSFAETGNYLDILSGTDYIFTGLAIKESLTNDVTASLAPFRVTTTGDYEIDPSKLPITSLLDTDTGRYSIRVIEDSTSQGTNTTVASGDYSIALGKSTTASGEASTALGNNTEAVGDYSITTGTDTTANGEASFAGGSASEAKTKNSFAFGNNVKTSAENQVVFGKNNTEDENQLFILANDKNKFTVSYNGDIKALGTLETKGSIKATGETNNTLELGTSTSASSGSIKVYGEGTNEVFSVTNTGNTILTGNVNITKDDEYSIDAGHNINAALKVTGGAYIGKNLKVNGDVNLENILIVKNSPSTNETNVEVDGTLNVTGATSINNNLTVAPGKTTTLGGNTEITSTTDYSKEVDNTINASLKVAGGTYIEKQLIVGANANIGNKLILKTAPSTGETNIKVNGTLNVTEAAALSSTLEVTGNTTIGGTLVTAGATTLNNTLAVSDGNKTILGGALDIKGITHIKDETEYSKSGDNITAATIINGGVHIAKKLNVNSDLTAGTLTSGGSLTVGSNAKIVGTAIIENTVTITKDTIASNSTSGALKVSGGVGIAKNLITGGSATIGTSKGTNTLTIGASGTNNGSGALDIYGTTESKVFTVTNTGNTVIKGTLEVVEKLITNKDAEIGGKTTIDGTVEISNKGISGINSLTVEGKIEGAYFNAKSYNTSSDIRKKCNIEDYKFKKSILDLPIKCFEYINDESHTKYIGCIAQDLQEICPELVNENKEGMLTIQENKLIYALLQEVKELKEKVELLERK